MNLKQILNSLFQFDVNLFEKKVFLSLFICFLFDFFICAYGLSHDFLGLLSGIETNSTELSIFLALDFIIISLIFLKKISIRSAVPYFFLSITFKSFFDLVYTDGGHIILQGVLFFSTLSVLSNNQMLKNRIFKFIVFYFLGVYFFSGYQKIWDSDYISGGAILKVLTTPAWNDQNFEFFFNLFQSNPLLSKMIGCSVILFELIGPILFILISKFRIVFLVVIIIFHTMTFFLMDLTTFSVFMIILAFGILIPFIGRDIYLKK